MTQEQKNAAKIIIDYLWVKKISQQDKIDNTKKAMRDAQSIEFIECLLRQLNDLENEQNDIIAAMNLLDDLTN